MLGARARAAGLGSLGRGVTPGSSVAPEGSRVLGLHALGLLALLVLQGLWTLLYGSGKGNFGNGNSSVELCNSRRAAAVQLPWGYVTLT